MRPLVFVAVGVLLALAALAILIWVLHLGEDERPVQSATPPPAYVLASA